MVELEMRGKCENFSFIWKLAILKVIKAVYKGFRKITHHKRLKCPLKRLNRQHYQLRMYIRPYPLIRYFPIVGFDPPKCVRDLRICIWNWLVLEMIHSKNARKLPLSTNGMIIAFNVNPLKCHLTLPKLTHNVNSQFQLVFWCCRFHSVGSA